MKGLMLLQLELTGDLEKDRDILLLGMGGLLVLAIGSLVILSIFLLRRRKNRHSAQISADAPPEIALVEDTTGSEEDIHQEIAQIPEKEEETANTEQKGYTKPDVAEKEEPKISAAKEPSSEEKLEEIRRRLEEIRKKPGSGPVPVLPKIEAKKRETEPVILQEKEQVSDTENTNIVELPATEQESVYEQNEDSTVTENPSPETDKKEENKVAFAANKNLPMKKLTFAEWVELFKEPEKANL